MSTAKPTSNVALQQGDLLASKAQTLVNTVNTVGVMGKGIALQFKRAFPAMYQDYVERCERGDVRLGEPYLWRQASGPWVLNFPTKRHWRKPSSLAAIVEGLGYLDTHYRRWGITSLAVPPLGCGNGGLEWPIVGPTLYEHLARLAVPVELYAPLDTPHAQMTIDFLTRPAEAAQEALRLTPAAVALVAVLDRLEQDPYHWPVGSTTFQKLAYFATIAGLPTSLEFVKAQYGPYAKGLSRVATQLQNNGLLRQERLGRMNAFKVGPTFKDAQELYKGELTKWTPILERLTDLLARMRTRDAEFAASAHFAAGQLTEQLERIPTEGEVLEYVVDWKRTSDKPPTIEDLALAIRNLGVLGWLHVTSTNDLPAPDLHAQLA